MYALSLFHSLKAISIEDERVPKYFNVHTRGSLKVFPVKRLGLGPHDPVRLVFCDDTVNDSNNINT